MFKAILKMDVSYQDFCGQNHTVKAGQIVDILILNPMTIQTDTSGRQALQVGASFVATIGNDMFDIDSREFKTID